MLSPCGRSGSIMILFSLVNVNRKLPVQAVCRPSRTPDPIEDVEASRGAVSITIATIQRADSSSRACLKALFAARLRSRVRIPVVAPPTSPEKINPFLGAMGQDETSSAYSVANHIGFQKGYGAMSSSSLGAGRDRLAARERVTLQARGINLAVGHACSPS